MKIKFEELEEKDIEWARLLHNDPSVLKMLTDPREVSQDQQKKWFDSLKKSKNKKRLVVYVNDEKIGIIRLDEIDHNNKSIRVGLDVHKDFRNKGYGTLAYKKLLDYCFSELKFHRVYLMVAEYNKIALHLYEKLGFKKEGVMRQALFREGKYFDYIMMSILEEEYDKSI